MMVSPPRGVTVALRRFWLSTKLVSVEVKSLVEEEDVVIVNF